MGFDEAVRPLATHVMAMGGNSDLIKENPEGGNPHPRPLIAVELPVALPRVRGREVRDEQRGPLRKPCDADGAVDAGKTKRGAA
jgi:hypothetical protein